MKIGLVFLPAWIPYNPPLGISCISAALLKEGHTVELFDYNVLIYDGVKKAAGEFWLMNQADKWEEKDKFYKYIYPHVAPYIKILIKDIISKQLDAVGFSIYSSNSQITSHVIRLLRNIFPDLKVFVGGAMIDETSATKLLTDRLIDAAILGEGEESTLDLLKHWQDNIPITKISGTILRNKDDEIVEGDKRPLLNMKKLPIPDFSNFDLSKYTSQGFPVEFSRGCVAKCTFCSETNYWVSFRTKSPAQVVGEFEYFLEHFGINHFRIVDSLMNGNHKMLEDMCDLIIEKNLEIMWYGFCRISTKLTPALLKKMKTAGCIHINYGIESGSQKVLNLMKKKYKLPEIYQNVKDTYESGIEVHSQILIGFPGEGWYEYMETLKLIFNLRNFFDKIYPGIPLEITTRTHVWDNLESYNVIYENGKPWRTKNFTNTLAIRKFRHWFLVKFLNLIRMNQGYPLSVD
jgi:anaerobic magnesium-protoporphyrin IX monomethyl ester cyclase